MHSYRKLSPEESLDIKNAWIEKLGLSPDTNSLNLINDIEQKAVFVFAGLVWDYRFNLIGFLEYNNAFLKEENPNINENLLITPNDIVFINWYRYDDIDEISFKDLSDNLKDIWHPEADSMDIFYKSMKWMISISYDGFITFFFKLMSSIEID